MVSPTQERIVAVDSMVVVTHPSNEVSELSMDQLRGVFTGQITNWSQLGGADRPIDVVEERPLFGIARVHWLDRESHVEQFGKWHERVERVGQEPPRLTRDMVVPPAGADD